MKANLTFYQISKAIKKIADEFERRELKKENYKACAFVHRKIFNILLKEPTVSLVNGDVFFIVINALPEVEIYVNDYAEEKDFDSIIRMFKPDPATFVPIPVKERTVWANYIPHTMHTKSNGIIINNLMA